MIENQIEIEKNIPVPQQGGKWKEILKKMEIGDSFFITPSSQGASISNASRALGMRIMRRKEGDGARIWRTA